MNLRKLMNFTLNITLQRCWQPQLRPSIWQWLFMAAVTWTIIITGQRCQAQIIYVDPCVVGPGSGTESDPYKLLATAVAAAAPGTYIELKGGLYTETMTISKSLTLAAKDSVARIGANGYGVGWQDVSLDLGDGISTNARIYYPSWTTGPNTQIATPCEGGFPAVVYAHGKRELDMDLCDWCDDALRVDNTKDYLQVEGILKSLVSSGMIAISFNWHGLTVHYYHSSDPQNIAQYIINAINYLGEAFDDDINMDNLGLIGHSTGGAAVIKAAEMIRSDRIPPALIKGVGLIAPAFPDMQPFMNLSGPVLVIHGTNEHACQVANAPLEIYCRANVPKHLVVVTGANHFGYTDGICLDPNQQRVSICPWDSWELSPQADGWDNPCEVGGLSGQQAHALQQLTAARYLHAFFSYYLLNKSETYDYLVQKDDENCGHPDLETTCGLMDLDVYMWWPKDHPVTPCRYVLIEFRYLLGDDPNPVIINVPPVNQSVNGGRWNYIGSGVFPHTVLVKIISTGGCPTIADAIKFVAPGTLPIQEVYVDSDTLNRRTDASGTWEKSQAGTDWWGENYNVSFEQGATYTFSTHFYKGYNISDCEPISYFNKLQTLHVKINLCSCLELVE